MSTCGFLLLMLVIGAGLLSYYRTREEKGRMWTDQRKREVEGEEIL